MSKLERILIANRGEIAIRIAKTLRGMGRVSIGIYAEDDSNSKHVRNVDEAFSLKADGLSAYLSADKILTVAREERADAIHPGYGFLSENADFAKRVEEAGMKFIGPSSEVMRLLGDKSASKRFAQERGISTLEAFLEEERDDKSLMNYLAKVELPVILKPSAGGGGKGMVVLRSPEKFEQSIFRARSEALNAFGDERLMVEPFLEEARHVEVQVAGDQQGGATHLYERDCTLQRRHQKILEESPSPMLDDGTRQEILNEAERLTREAGYENLGTVEFILDGKGRYYFMEMNTRLQVEHPVTEAITGFDLVEGQIRIAEGEDVEKVFPNPSSNGHAIECRIYAEEPERDFLPSSGRILKMRLPEKVRIDSGIEEGNVISPDFDPMLLKVIVHGKNRNEAFERMKAALEEMVLLGLQTNKDFLLWLCENNEVRKGEIQTRWIDEILTRYQKERENLFLEEAILAAIHFQAWERQRRFSSSDEEMWEFDPWETLGALRVGGVL